MAREPDATGPGQGRGAGDDDAGPAGTLGRLRRWSMRLGVSASWFSVLTVLITAAVIHVPWEMTSRENVRDVVRQLNAQIVTSVRREVDAMLAEAEAVQATIRRMGRNGGIDFDDPEDVLNSYFAFLRSHPYFSWVSYGMPDGDFYGVQRRADGEFSQVISHWDAEAGRARRTTADFTRDGGDGTVRARRTRIETNQYYSPQRSWYQKASARPGEVIWTDVYVFATSGKPGLNTAVARGLGDDGAFHGVISIAIELQRISTYLQSRDVAEGGEIVLFDADGRLLAASDPELLQQRGTEGDRLALPRVRGAWHPVLRTLTDAFARHDVAPAKVDGTRLVEATNPAGEAAFVSVRPLGFQDWRVATIVPQHAVTGDIEAHRLRLLGILAAAVVVISAIALWVARRLLVRPLQALTAQTERVADLDTDAVRGVTSHIREIDALSRSLRRTAGSLRAFGKYLPTELLRALHAQGVRPEVGGERRTLTVFFMDVVSFTSHTERMGHRIVPVLTAYIEAVSDEIAGAGGTIDKYIGDAVMAFWGAPQRVEEHATDACRAALACLDRIGRLNAEHADDPTWPALDVRIGINTGRVVVGNMGSHELLDYTVMGDPVNLASRLEGLAGAYGVRIVIGQASYEHAKYDIVARKLDFVTVKGRDERVAVHEVLAMADQNLGWPEGYDWVATYEAGLEHLLNREPERAAACFREVIAARGDDPPSRVMLARAEASPAEDAVPRLADQRDAGRSVNET